MSTRTADYNYDLPEELIASRPAERREDARMMVVDRQTGVVAHHSFREFPELMPTGALAILNDTRVIPARVFDEARGVEALLLECTGGLVWRAMVKPGRKMRIGQRAELAGATATVVEVEEDGTRVLEFDREPDLDCYGVMPLPPYIRRVGDAADRERYQTVYAREPGAVAAPTAGLHFTPEILARILHTSVTLHVGAGTFKPVQAEDVSGHTMHKEKFHIDGKAAAAINAASARLAVGTTVVRVLESVAEEDGRVSAVASETDIFIYPPYRFRATSHLLTNFHLPCSTLLMLVSAFAGRDLILEAYREAVASRYRFFSYGDCMLIL